MGCGPDIQNLSSDTMSHLNFASNDIQIIPSSDSDSPEKMGLGAG